MQEFGLILTLLFNICAPIDFSKQKWLFVIDGLPYRALFVQMATHPLAE